MRSVSTAEARGRLSGSRVLSWSAAASSGSEGAGVDVGQAEVAAGHGRAERDDVGVGRVGVGDGVVLGPAAGRGDA